MRAVLERHRAALCWADRAGRAVTPRWRTADFGYLRLHTGGGKGPGYDEDTLSRWRQELAAAFEPDTPVFVYFNNDPEGAALVDAETFAGLCRRNGQPVSRTPGGE